MKIRGSCSSGYSPSTSVCFSSTQTVKVLPNLEQGCADLCHCENQNNNIPNAISIYIWKSCSWCSQDSTWKMNGVQCPDGLACGKNSIKETCTWGTRGHPYRVPQNLLEKEAREIISPILCEGERHIYKLRQTAVESKILLPAFLQIAFESGLKSCCASFLASL